MSQQALDLIAIAKKNRATRLDIGNCNLTELPDELFELTWLEELIVSDLWSEYSFEKKEWETFKSQNNEEHNNITSIHPNIKSLKGLKKLISVSQKKLSDLSPLKDLQELKYLDVISTQVSNLSPLKNLYQLKELYASDTQVSDLSFLKDLKQLRQLWIGNSLVRDLSPLKNLQQLQKLYVNETQVSDLSPLKNLQQLQRLNIRNTQVSDLSPLKDLQQLQELNIKDTQVSDLSPLKDLQQLQELSISGIQVSDLSPLKDLQQLQELDVSFTLVSDLSPLKDLQKLQKLWINEIQVSDLSPLKDLQQLQELWICDIQVSDLSPLKDLQQLQELFVRDTQVSDLSPLRKAIQNNPDFILAAEGCPLTNPPKEIVKQGNAAILRYWEEQDRVGLKKVNEARLLLVGEGNSGKTTLKDKLKDPHAAMPEHDATTRGINIERLHCTNRAGEDFTVQVWDFGGQNIQKYAHQFFMSDSVVYVVLSNTREQNQNFQYWLNIIELLGKDSPFFIVQNEKDGHAEALKDISQIQERFPTTFQSVEHVNLKNAATDKRFDALRLKLFEAATQLPHTQKEYLVSFVNVRQQLARLSETEQTIPFKQFKQLCKAEGIEDPELMNDYARTFTLLGIALHFEDDLHLSAQVFLRPKWIIDALFAVLYADIVAQQQGKFTAADAKKIWQAEMYDDMHGVLLQLMVKFHLCYDIPNTSDYIVPQRLPTRSKEEAFVPPPDATHLLYRYKFLPSGLLTQLTCRLHQRIEGAKVWNDAVQFSTKNGEGHVFVRENSADNHLELFGFGRAKTDLINTVVDTIDAIHQNSKFGNLKVEKLVPCPGAVCTHARSKNEDAKFFNYDDLIEQMKEGDTESDRCRYDKRRFPIRDILKNSSIRLVNVDKIRDLLAADKVEEALKILRGPFGSDNDVIVQLQRLSHINRQHDAGQMTAAVYSVERTRLIKAVLGMLTEWEG
jgi:internalin A